MKLYNATKKIFKEAIRSTHEVWDKVYPLCMTGISFFYTTINYQTDISMLRKTLNGVLHSDFGMCSIEHRLKEQLVFERQQSDVFKKKTILYETLLNRDDTVIDR